MDKSIVELYLSGLRDKFAAEGHHKALRDLTHATGAAQGDIDRLRAQYPLCPASLLDLLQEVDGTYHRQYGAHKVSCYLLGSDEFELPYYLLSAAEIIASGRSPFSSKTMRDCYGADLDQWLEVTRARRPGEGNRDPRVDPDLPRGQWLHFADCMNNGGTSKLFIDFNPVGGGKVGQIIQFIHDPDSYQVIADSFDQYLRGLIANDYWFIYGD